MGQRLKAGGTQPGGMGTRNQRQPEENEVLSLLQGLHQRAQEQNELLEDIRRRGVPVMERREAFTTNFPYSLSLDVPANTVEPNTATETIEVPHDGIVDGVLVGWPGADGAVGIQFRNETGERFFPRNEGDQFEAMPAAHVELLPIRFMVEEGETLVGEYVNTDAGNSHFASLMPNIQERPPGMGDDEGQ